VDETLLNTRSVAGQQIKDCQGCTPIQQLLYESVRGQQDCSTGCNSHMIGHISFAKPHITQCVSLLVAAQQHTRTAASTWLYRPGHQ
jgi:hypothetical protein